MLMIGMEAVSSSVNETGGLATMSVKRPKIFLTEPSGIHSEWKANAIGRNSKVVREFLEKSWSEGLARHAAMKLTVQALLEVVQTGPDNLEIVIMDSSEQITVIHTVKCYLIQPFLSQHENHLFTWL